MHNKYYKITLKCYIFVHLTFKLKFIFKYIALFICFGSFAQTLTSPQIGCVSILPNGNIAVTWSVTPGLGGQFASYQIYTSPTLNNPSYTNQAGITNYNTNTYVITTITNANTQPYFIYIHTITTSSITLTAVDTVRTLFLSVTSPVGAPGIAHLSWNGFAQPIPAGEASSYSVYRKYYYNGGGWAFIASVPFNPSGNINYNYYDTITVCKDSIDYKIELTNTLLNCTSVSNVAGANFQNKNNPTPPPIDSVSTINNGTQIIIGISPAYSQDVKCFDIYGSDGSTYTQIGLICNYNQATTYTYIPNPSPAVGSVTVSVVSQDSCGNLSQFPINQSTIYTTASYNQCKKTAYINWTPYQNMVTGVHDYQIFCSTNNGPFVCIGDTNATVYYHKGLAPGTTYCYFVRAHSNGKTIAGKDTASSTSSQFCITTNNPPISSFAYLNNVTVNAQQTIDVQWNVDNAVLIGGYNLYRATNKTGPYNLVSYIPSTNAYSDASVNTNSEEYFYFIQVLDTCLNPTLQTDTSNNIVLKAVPSANSTATLNWNNYAKYLGGVSGYNIYRSVNGIFSIAATNIQGTNYVDDLSPFAADEGTFIYYVEAVEGPGDPYLLAEKSQSNYDTVYVDANLYIPNSFTPNGKNKLFLPIGAYIDNSDYQLDIYDRFGQKIYETTDPNTGWNGGGHQEGVYAYTVQYKTSIGEYRQRHGTVNLIR